MNLVVRLSVNQFNLVFSIKLLVNFAVTAPLYSWQLRITCSGKRNIGPISSCFMKNKLKEEEKEGLVGKEKEALNEKYICLYFKHQLCKKKIMCKKCPFSFAFAATLTTFIGTCVSLYYFHVLNYLMFRDCRLHCSILDAHRVPCFTSEGN